MDPAENETIDERIPCADEMCTGILDAHGKCGTCGRVGDPAVIERLANADASGPDAAEASEATEASAPSEPSEPGGASEASAPPSEGDEDRVPCSDEMCTGILGADGVCGTCGKKG